MRLTKPRRIALICLLVLLLLAAAVAALFAFYVPHNLILSSLDAKDIDSVIIYGRGPNETAELNREEIEELVKYFNKIQIIGKRSTPIILMGGMRPHFSVKLSNGKEHKISVDAPFDIYLTVDDVPYLIEYSDGFHTTPAYNNYQEITVRLAKYQIKYFPDMFE